MKFHTGRSRHITALLPLLLLLLLVIDVYNIALAGPREQARRIHDRLAGIPPSDSVLNTMEGAIAGGDEFGAALIAMENSAFYNVTLKNFATPWTNEDQTVFAPLNDYTATVIGMIRDEVPFTEVLSADMV